MTVIPNDNGPCALGQSMRGTCMVAEVSGSCKKIIIICGCVITLSRCLNSVVGFILYNTFVLAR